MSRHAVTAALFAATVASAAFAQAPATRPAAAPATTPAAVGLNTDQERVGYTIGQQLGSKIKADGVDVDQAAFSEGLKDGLTGTKSKMTEAEMDDTMKKLQTQLEAQSDAKAAAAPANNKKVGDAFLADNAKKDGVKSTASGLQYKVIKSGTGKSPKATDKVSVTYKGTHIDGTEFDSSKDGPVSFAVNGVIPGWTEALQLMKEGDKWQLVIPSKLAYAERGTPGGPIGPNEVLVFEVELLQVGGK
jgi:FKBP-type peptidyl-prolyl cis-trans isomerase FklB